MKIKSVLILALSASSFTAAAQFNTVSNHKALYSIRAVSDSVTAGNKQEMVPTRQREDTISIEDKKKEWTDRYMSVSYPHPYPNAGLRFACPPPKDLSK